MLLDESEDDPTEKPVPTEMTDAPTKWMEGICSMRNGDLVFGSLLVDDTRAGVWVKEAKVSRAGKDQDETPRRWVRYLAMGRLYVPMARVDYLHFGPHDVLCGYKSPRNNKMTRTRRREVADRDDDE